jgi:hypothetical protein
MTRYASYWLVHPDVVDIAVLDDPGEIGEHGYETKLWLKPTPEVEWPDGAVKPERAPDIELFVEGAPHPTFTSRLPALQYVEQFVEAMPDEVYTKGWWVARIWISDAVYKLHEDRFA